MKHLITKHISLLILFLSFTLYSQEDSLRSLITSSEIDSVKVNLMIELSKSIMMNEEFEESEQIANEALNLSKKIEYDLGKAYALKQLGILYYYQGKYGETYNYWTQSLEAFEKIDNAEGIANITNNLGSIYMSQGVYIKAMDYFLRSLSESEKIGNIYRITTSTLNVGNLYGEMKDYDKALTYFKRIKSTYLDELDDPQLESAYLMGMGEIYNKKNLPDSSRKYYLKALKITEGTQDYTHNLNMLGKNEYSVGNYEKAIEYLEKSYDIATEKNYPIDRVIALNRLGQSYTNINPDVALEKYYESVTLAKEINAGPQLRDAYKGIAEVLEKKGDFKDALAYQTKFLALKDSLFNVETDDKIRGMMFDFELDKKQNQIGLLEKEAEIAQLNEKRQKNLTVGTGIGAGLIFIIALGILNRYRFIQKTNRLINIEKARSEKLLLNILPKETAQELKQFGKVKAKRFNEVTVMFTDFKGFTYYSENLSPEDLVRSVDYYFSEFDAIIEKYNIEKIKTIGDAYMCVSGMPFPDNHNPHNVIAAAYEIIKVVENVRKKQPDIFPFEIRVGINTGPVVAGVVGIKKFAYDIWGDTVNVAARMESSSEPSRINISESTYNLVNDIYQCHYRGEVEVKNRGKLQMYFVDGIKSKKTENQPDIHL
ncbi:adenylate/guanylate cyclase domain-containing protein [Marinigracilibium pacificum]|uniref:Adenylate cyclase n=1 Tax=Marinigracilibium pacificum TaxID=2729599 RepID=A0A848J2G4_9BACT|nr:adenylate/guanylate cyclase domain-containing protein [Marinigracilibium pacificum]NMM48509.1 tetratricopeptide repeat protein [Marinigracilibium pacificum]